MKTRKISFSVKIEVLSIDSIPSLLTELAVILERENTSGLLNKDDGDLIKWNYKQKKVKL